jgi:hypothetical protein
VATLSLACARRRIAFCAATLSDQKSGFCVSASMLEASVSRLATSKAHHGVGDSGGEGNEAFVHGDYLS